MAIANDDMVKKMDVKYGNALFEILGLKDIRL